MKALIARVILLMAPAWAWVAAVEPRAGGVAADFPTTEEVQSQWPSFRGPSGLGVAASATAPSSWNAKTGVNVRWKTAIPLPGTSSPVVWRNSVLITGASANENRVLRFDADTGTLTWSSAVQVPGGARSAAPKVGEETSLAAPTAATDGRRVYAIFPNGKVAAFDFAGKQAWAINVGPLENAYGYAASLAIFQDRLMIQTDRGEPEDGQSKVLALDTQTGKLLWESRREVAGSWSSPVVFNVSGQPQLITCANPLVIAYSPVDGKELWRTKCLDGDVAPSPILAGNMIVAVAPGSRLIGLQPGAARISWKAEEGVPDVTSPVSDGQRVYVVSSDGLLSCYNAQTGKTIWTHEFDEHFYASPVIAGRTLILISRKGVAHLLATGDEFKKIGKGEFGEEIDASPAPVGNRLYVRGKKNLFCIEGQAK